jgi:hypothetical protein
LDYFDQTTKFTQTEVATDFVSSGRGGMTSNCQRGILVGFAASQWYRVRRVGIAHHTEIKNGGQCPPYQERCKMPPVATAAEVLDREFLGIRARILDLAAALDRIDRAGGVAAGDLRMARIGKGLEVLLGPGEADRAERVQQAFSLPYRANWRQEA